MNAKFEALASAEHIYRLNKDTQGFAPTTGVSDYQAGVRATGLAADKAKFDRLFAELTLEEMREYGEYRKEAFGI